MFKAAVIDNDDYYRLRTRQLILMLLFPLLIGFIVNVFKIPTWLSLSMICLYVVVMVLMFTNQRKLNSMLGKRVFEMDDKQIRIKSGKGTVLRTFDLKMVERILVKEDYTIPQETMEEIGKEIVGATQRNYLIIQQDGQDIRIDFEIDSHYMIVQLNKAINAWKALGGEVEILS